MLLERLHGPHWRLPRPAILFMAFGGLVLALTTTRLPDDVHVCRPDYETGQRKCRYVQLRPGTLIQFLDAANANEGFLLALLAAGAGIVAVLQWRTMRQQHASAVAVQRPWLKFLPPEVRSLEFRDSGMVLKIEVGVQNVGNTPATGVYFLASVVPLPLNDLDLNTASRNCSNPAIDRLRKFVGGCTVFPNDKHSETRIISVDAKELVAAARRSVEAGNDEGAFLNLGGCCRYDFGGGSGTTTFDYLLTAKGLTQMGWSPNTRGPVNLRAIELIPNKRGEYAD